MDIPIARDMKAGPYKIRVAGGIAAKAVINRDIPAAAAPMPTPIIRPAAPTARAAKANIPRPGEAPVPAAPAASITGAEVPTATFETTVAAASIFWIPVTTVVTAPHALVARVRPLVARVKPLTRVIPPIRIGTSLPPRTWFTSWIPCIKDLAISTNGFNCIANIRATCAASSASVLNSCCCFAKSANSDWLFIVEPAMLSNSPAITRASSETSLSPIASVRAILS